MSWQLEDLDASVAPDATGAPLLLPIEAIDEDPTQPRKEFDRATLQELAETIKVRGVRQPVSVRPHPTEEGRYILNFGARRLRASRLAGKAEIPAFVDKGLDGYDQVIENEQRDSLRPLELAAFMKREIDAGKSQVEIARDLGKTQPYVSLVCVLIDAPEWLRALYREGKCRGLKEMADLRRLHESHPAVVDRWLADHDFVSRADIASLRDQCRPNAPVDAAEPLIVQAGPAFPDSKGEEAIGPLPAPSTQRSTRKRVAKARSALLVLAELDDSRVRVVVDDLPNRSGDVFVEDESGSARRAVAIERLRSLRLTRT